MAALVSVEPELGERAVENDQHIGERIAFQRRKRGISQTVLAGLVGRSESWLSQVERGHRSIDKLSVLVPMAKALRVDLAVLLDEPLDFSRQGTPDLAAIDAIRAAISTYVIADVEDERDIPDASTMEAVLVEINASNQATQYDRAGSLLPLAIRQAQVAVDRASGPDQERQALALAARTHQVTAALLSRIGEIDLGWVAADRAINAAKQAEDIEQLIAGVYRLGQIMLRAGRNDEAFRLAESLLSTVDSDDTRPSMLSLHGALLLTAAIAAARLSDRRESTRLLMRAQTVADRLGEDRNDHWTAFGPSNVRIHATSAAVELGDPHDVLNQASTVDLGGLPDELRGRRSQLHVDMAWAYGQQRNDPAAVLSLIEAERLAPDAVRFSPLARDVIHGCLRRSKRKGAVPGLTGLAERVGVMAS